MAGNKAAGRNQSTRVGHARPEFAITLAIIGILVAIGVPALRSGSVVAGWLCIGLAIIVAAWEMRTIIRVLKGPS